MPTAFVTGGSGFVGRNLIPYLITSGYQVKALARSESAARTVRELGAEPVQGDMDAPEGLEAALRGCDVVFHAAAQVADWGDVAIFMRTNVEGTQKLMEQARKGGVPRFVHVSTEAVLVGSKAPRIINSVETQPLPERPLGVYSLTKGLAEKAVQAANAPGFTTVIVRPRFVWGKGDTTLLPRLVQGARDGSLMWIGGGQYLTSTCHVRNLCEGMVCAAQRGEGSQIYYLTDGEPVVFRQFISAMLETQNVKPPTRSVPYSVAHVASIVMDAVWRLFRLRGQPPLPHGTFHLICEEVTVNDARARRELGYVGRVDRAKGLAELRIGQ